MSEKMFYFPVWRVRLAAVVAVMAVYFYFLIFAEFALLELVKPLTVDGARLRVFMGVLGAGGVAGSLAAGWRFKAFKYTQTLEAAFIVCGISGFFSWGAAELGWWHGLLVAGGLTGATLGWLTVMLSAGLRAAVGFKRLGLCVGAGTGGAYALCNLPWIFHAGPTVQTCLAILGLAAGAGVAQWLVPVQAEISTTREYGLKTRAAWVLIFMALVWMDSAAFYIIQHTEAWRAATWGGVASLAGNSGMHFGAALIAGWLLDRGRSGRVVLAAFGLLASACVLLDFGGARMGWVALLYTAGVSFYSVALVYYPAAGGRPWLVALVFAIAGWIGSAMGIGMAQDLNRVPLLFVVLAGAAVTGALWVRKRELGRVASGALVLAVALCEGFTPDASAQERIGAQVLRGREVYIVEGCIHCHSQYVRPGTGDELLWGPSRPLAASLAEQPPLFGNRRQGPDLMNVGNRRSPEWNRLHLIAPRTVSPGSRMPSYAFLFKHGGGRGEDLVAYLASLGADTVAQRLEATKDWKPTTTTLDRAGGGRLFSQLCSGCHGVEGRGDGSLAARLALAPPDFSRGGWRVANPADLELSVERIIKFGVPGTAMAGHEYLQDAEVVSLARFVEAMHPVSSQ